MTGAILGVILAGVGLSDYLIVEKPRSAEAGNEQSSSAAEESSSAASEVSSTDDSSSSREPVPKGVPKNAGRSVEEILAANGYVQSDTDEQSVMAASATNTEVRTMTLLKDDDRAAFMAWIDTPDVKTIFALLKQTLAQSFSGQVQELIDETVRPPNGIPRDVLAFIDPTIGEERFVFIRVKTRLYEFHVPAGKDEMIADLIEQLSQ